MAYLVCFDLGGVLVRIRRTWQQAALAAGVQTVLPETELYPITDFPLFDAYQLGAIDDHEYLRELASYLGVEGEEPARAIHLSILDEPYPGAADLVHELKESGIETACLSNTNTLHWTELVRPGRFSCISDLRYKMTSHEMRLLKPDPALFRLFDTEATTSPQAVFYFDDHEGNVEAAQKHGWRSFFVDHENDPVAEIRAALLSEGLLKR